MNIKQKILIFFILCANILLVSGQLTVKDPDQDLKLDKALQKVQDSLEVIYQEELNQKIDSLKSLYQNKQDQFLAEFNKRKQVNYQYIQNLEDSLTGLEQTLQKYKNRNSVRDSTFEKRYYKYIDELLEYKDKKRTSILGVKIGGREINAYKIDVLQNYLARYYPNGKSAYIQYYLTQVYKNQKEYAKMEHAFLKFLYFYTDSPAYSELKHSLLELILNNRYFRDRSSAIVKIMDNIQEGGDFATRFFQFAMQLKNYPNQEVREFFVQEVNNYVNMFAGSSKSARLLYHLHDYYLQDDKIQYAFLTLDKIVTMYPHTPQADTARFQQGEIRAEQFNEYNEALSDYNRFIEENPASDMAVKAYYRIAKIFDNYMQKYDMAFNKYRKIARDYPHSEYAIQALDRSAAIAEEELQDDEEAIDLYQQLIEESPNSAIGQKARLKLARLYYQVEMHQKSIDQYFILYRQAPMDEKSIDYIFQAANIYEEDLNNIDKAIETLTHITENFPGTKAAHRAQDRIDKLSQTNSE